MQKKKNGPLVADRVSPIIVSRSMWRKLLVNRIIPILGLSEKKAPLNPLVSQKLSYSSGSFWATH